MCESLLEFFVGNVNKNCVMLKNLSMAEAGAAFVIRMIFFLRFYIFFTKIQ
jgi:hypothetical protein